MNSLLGGWPDLPSLQRQLSFRTYYQQHRRRSPLLNFKPALLVKQVTFTIGRLGMEGLVILPPKSGPKRDEQHVYQNGFLH